MARCGSYWAIIGRVRDSEPRGAGPAASEAVWTAERTNVFNKLYLQTDSRLLPRRRRGCTRTPCGTRCRSVARSHLIPAYRPPHLIVKSNSRRHTASPRFASITQLSVDGRVPLRPVRTMCRRAHLHTIDASPFSRLEQLDANRTPSPYQEANGLVLDRLKVESVVEMIITTSPNLSWYMLGDRTVSRLMWRSGTATVHQPFRRRRRVAAVSSLPSRSVTSAILQSADVVHETPIFADFSSTGATSVKSYFARPSFSEQM